LYYNKFYHKGDKAYYYKSLSRGDGVRLEDEDDEYLFGEKNKYNHFLLKFFDLRQDVFP